MVRNAENRQQAYLRLLSVFYYCFAKNLSKHERFFYERSRLKPLGPQGNGKVNRTLIKY